MDIAGLDAISILQDETFLEIMDIKDQVERERLIQDLTDKAKVLGVKEKFTKILNAFKKKEKEYLSEHKEEKHEEQLNNYTQFDIEGTEYENLFCGSWIANEKGVHMLMFIGNFPIEKLACYHPILPVMRLENAETGKEKITLAFRKGLNWKEVTVDKGVIASANKIVQLADYGVSVTSESSKTLVSYLADVENFNVYKIPTQTSTSKLGWIKGEFMPYGLNIIFDNETRFKAAFDSIKQAGSKEAWYNLAKDIRRSDRFEPKIYLAGALASVLIDPLNALPFVVNLWGDTGKGKTVAIMFAASVWAYPGGNDYVTDPKSTVTALELRLDFLNNLPMLIDDTAQLKEKYSGDFSELVYFLCSGKGKDRANASLGLNKSTSWKNVILTNGEHSLVTETMQGGAVNRIIDVEMADGYIFLDGNSVVETIKQDYGWCGKDFIDVINFVGIDEIRDIQKDFLKQINDRAKELGIEKEEKQTLPMSILLTADKIATDYLFEDNQYLDFEYCVDLLKNKDDVSENERAYEYIMGEVSANSKRFDLDVNGELWGKKDNGYITIIRNVFNQICDRGNVSSKSFLSWAHKRGIIKSTVENNKVRYTKKIRVGGNLCNCVIIKAMKEQEEFEQQSFLPATDEDVPFN